MERKTETIIIIGLMLTVLIIGAYVGYKHLKYIEIMKHSPCDLCIQCPNNIVNKINWSIPYEFLNGTTKI